ncbi:hypothetical protein DRO66_01480 [Candidatus Bathyarchaeota archaeon]|nr:MAG: hypothetical protein DRO66_01480 [Candidatus Bathyarchaeota archaeon]
MVKAMMHIYKLDGNTMDIVSCPPQGVQKGDYIIVRDDALNRSLIVQVTNIGYANIPGVLEDILRDSSTKNMDGQNLDFLGVKAFVDVIKDARVFRCKIRKAIVNGRIDHDISWTPSRSTSQLINLTDREFLELIGLHGENTITLGTTKGGAEVTVNLAAIDGKLNIITGKKGTGKSHLSKLLLLSLIEKGGICVVFDVNGEYINLGYGADYKKATPHEKIIVLSPGKRFKVTLEYMGLGVFLRIMSSVLDLPDNSAWEIRRIWSSLSQRNTLTLKNLRKAVDSVLNNYVRDALIRRIDSLVSTGLLTDNLQEASTLEDLIFGLNNGGALIINLRGLPTRFCHIVVEFMLSKLCNLLERWVLRALFLFAEEAHLYLRKTYWEDIVTRMRHLGLFSTFITNQPDSISDGIYRQADNVFLFNFTNENDLAAVSKATMVDVETINVIARELPPHYCLALGRVTNDFPIIIEVKALNVKTMGETRLFFTNAYKQKI